MVSEFARSSLHVIWLFQLLRDGKDIGEAVKAVCHKAVDTDTWWQCGAI